MSEKHLHPAIVKAEDEKAFVTLEDGFVYFWVDHNGCLPAHALRALADELDRRNAPWQAQIEEYFRSKT